MKVGIVYNINAGKKILQKELLKVLNKKREDNEVFCTSVSYDYLKDYLPGIKKIDIGKSTNTYLDSVNSGKVLADMDYIVSFGGDGTVSDIIVGQHKANRISPIFGVACGTANAGLFIQCKSVEELNAYDFNCINKQEVLGLDVFMEDEYIGTAFNDVVFSDTLLSTVNENVCTVNASDFLNGSRTPQYPTMIKTPFTEIKINSNKVEIPEKISQIIISPVYDKNVYIAKAVSGKLSWMPFYDKDGIMTISADPVICMASADNLKSENVMTISQYLIGMNETIHVKGTKGYAIVDGNPRINMEDNTYSAKIVLNKSAAYKLQVKKYIYKRK